MILYLIGSIWCLLGVGSIVLNRIGVEKKFGRRSTMKEDMIAFLLAPITIPAFVLLVIFGLFIFMFRGNNEADK